MKKRAQLMSHPFTMILTLVLAALIIFFGVSAIINLVKVSSQVDLASFRTSLQKEVDTYYNLDEGSQKIITLQLPGEVNYICFVDQSMHIDYSLIPNGKENLVKVITNKNVFPIPEIGQPSLDPINIEHLKPESNPLCIKTSSRLVAKITSQGTHVSISK